MPTRHVVIVLGDQLNFDSSAFDGLDKPHDVVWMAEVPEESEHVWSHKARSTLFLAAMRHFAADLKKQNINLHYHQLGTHLHSSLGDALTSAIKLLRPQKLIVCEPGDWRVRELLLTCAKRMNLSLEIREDRHFYSSINAFEQWAEGRKRIQLEQFYRHLRKQEGILMDQGKPKGGRWNYDSDNRRSFGKEGPGRLPAGPAISVDRLTRDVMGDVDKHLNTHPGSLENFAWPVTRKQAQSLLRDFIKHRLSAFGPWQDAMWVNEPFLYHSRLASALNLKLLNPREVVNAALQAYEDARAPLSSVEGFVRQILGWREYLRGIYWTQMPDYLQHNSLKADADLPSFYWTADTDMVCLNNVIKQTLDYGYAHHIQRLMVTGLFTLLFGVQPKQVHEWYLAVYVDAVEWVEAPNTLGMSQYADGGLLASKPYCASGKYIQQMSNYCDQCRYNPANSTGPEACPFTTLYWDFLARHRKRFADHPRAALQWRNLEGIDGSTLTAIRSRAKKLQNQLS